MKQLLVWTIRNKMTLELSEGNTTAFHGVDLVSSGAVMDTGSVQVLAMSHVMYKIGTFKQLLKHFYILSSVFIDLL